MNQTASLFYPCQCILGESPVWHPGQQACFWVDIEGRRLYRYDWTTQVMRHWDFDVKVTLVVIDSLGHLVLGLKGGLARFNPDTGWFQLVLDIEKDLDDHRCNDGRCDSKGRLWIGTMQEDCLPRAGKLYCVDENMQLHQRLDRVSISNGLVWSLDNSKMYFVDSPTQSIQAFAYDPDPGTIRFERIAVDIPQHMGSPDGMAIDEEGMLWVAHWGGFGVNRWDPDSGKLIGQIRVPVPHVSSCAFVGDDLKSLLITTARQHLSTAQLDKYPQSGDVFICDVPVRGKADFPCKIVY